MADESQINRLKRTIAEQQETIRRQEERNTKKARLVG